MKRFFIHILLCALILGLTSLNVEAKPPEGKGPGQGKSPQTEGHGKSKKSKDSDEELASPGKGKGQGKQKPDRGSEDSDDEDDRGPHKDRQNKYRGLDKDGDGVITRAEWPGSDTSFHNHDWNGDGVLSGDEVRPGARKPDLQQDKPAEDEQGWWSRTGQRLKSWWQEL